MSLRSHDTSPEGNSSQLWRIEIESEKSNCFSVNLQVVYNLNNNPLLTLKRSGHQLVNKRTLLGYSLLTTTDSEQCSQ